MEDSVHMHVYIHVPLVNGNQRKKEEGWYFPLSDRVLHCAISVPVLLESEKSNKKNPYIMCINTIKCTSKKIFILLLTPQIKTIEWNFPNQSLQRWHLFIFQCSSRERNTWKLHVPEAAAAVSLSWSTLPVWRPSVTWTPLFAGSRPWPV